jgi:hypothetical protein
MALAMMDELVSLEYRARISWSNMAVSGSMQAQSSCPSHFECISFFREDAVREVVKFS